MRGSVPPKTEDPERFERVHVVRLLAGETCARLIARANTADAWEPSAAYSTPEAGLAQSERRASLSILERDRRDVFEPVRGEIEASLARFIAEDATPRFTLSRFEMIRYDAGGGFPLHRDAAAGDSRRQHSVLVYLNDDFDGGSTSFPMIGRFVRPHSGKAILFPSCYLHAGEPVVSGRKYVLTCYLGQPADEPDWF